MTSRQELEAQLEELATGLKSAGLEREGLEALAQLLGLWVDPVAVADLAEFSSLSLARGSAIGAAMREHRVDPRASQAKYNTVGWVLESDAWRTLRAGRQKETVNELVWWTLLRVADDRLLVPDAQGRVREEMGLAHSNTSRAFGTLASLCLIEQIAFRSTNGSAVWRVRAPAL